MMASAPQPFPHPGGMPGHGGMPHGHPMGPGHPSGQGMPSGGQPGVSMAQQMHGMGGHPQVSQGGPMVGMPQGGGPGVSVGGPSAHALSHLNPSAHPQMYHQQQQQQQMMQAAANPNVYQQQQAARLQHQQRLQFLAQQHQHQQGGGGGMVMNGGGPIVGMPNLPAHMQQQQLQAQQLQQQQRQQHLQQQQQQHMQQQMAQQLAMQNAQGHPPSSQPTPQGPMRPPSVMQNQSDQQSMPQQQAQAQAAQHQGQGPQPGQPQGPQQHPQQPPNQPQQQQQPGQPQGPQGMQQQGNQQPHQGPQQGQPGQPQQAQQRELAQQMQQRQQQAMMNAQMMNNQRMGNPMKGQSTLKLFNFGDQLSLFKLDGNNNTIRHWYNFVNKFFSNTGVLRQVLTEKAGQEGESSKTFEFTIGSIPRYYWTFYQSGVQHIQMIMESASEKDLTTGSFVECPRASVIYWHANGQQVVMKGTLKAQFDVQGKIVLLEQHMTEFEEYIARQQMKTHKLEADPKLSPNLTKNNKKNQQRPKVPEVPSYTLPDSVVNGFGVTAPCLTFFEIAEVFTQLDGFLDYYSQNQDVPPHEALRRLVSSFGNNGENTPAMPNDNSGNFNPAFNQQNPGQRTPGQGFGPNGPQQFQSPLPGAHLNLPVNTNSPGNMNMSPAMQQNALGGGPVGQPQPNSVAMAHQASQQGSATGSQGTSANTSPHVTNKKRRASAVKTEMDGDTDINGKVKQSPRVGGKRQKPA